MSDSDDDLFGASSNDDGGDTDELIAASKAADAKPIAKKKKTSSGGGGRLKKKGASAKNIPDADNDSDDEATGLFDSDEEGDGDGDDSPKKKSAAKKKAPKKKAAGSGKPMTKREKMEALRAKKRAANGEEELPKRGRDKDSKKKSSDPDAEKEKGYNSGNSYDSGAEYVRTKDDDDFIDVEGEDEEVVKEYYREQRFDDERPEGDYSDDEEEGRRKKSRGGKSSGKRKAGPDTLSAADKADEDNPMMQAVNRMKKKKKVVRTFEEVKDLAQEFVASMDNAADHDDIAMVEKRVPLSKLKLLPKAVEIMTKVDMVRPLLEADVLVAIKRWIKPMPNGSLGNVTVRQRLLECVSKMTGENGIDTDDLKRSEFGKLAMVLYKHKKETPQIKKILRGLIEQWGRQIFKKSGDMRDLQSAQSSRRREGGLTAISRAYAVANEEEEASAAQSQKRSKSSKRGLMHGDDIGDVISNGVKQGRDSGKNRVRIPYSKGFHYTVRPSDVTGDVSDKKTRISTVKEARGSLHKRMLEKTRPVSKNSRSANISIEGRVAK